MSHARPSTTLTLLVLLVFGGFGQEATAQLWGARNPNAPMRKAAEMISRQPPPKINRDLESVINPGNSHVIISLSKQRAYLMTGDEVYIDTPVSTG